MKAIRMIAAGALVACVAGRAHAQCAAGNPVEAQDACRKAVDLINYVTPQMATALAGGNATLGQGGTLAGFGHFAIDIRGTGVRGALPKFGDKGFSTTGETATTYESEAQWIPGATVDAAIGIWRGFSLGVTHVGGVDALVSVTYLPNVEEGELTVKTSGGNMKFAYGVRVGLLEEGLLTPGVAVTWLQRELPTVTLSGKAEVGTGVGTAPGDVALRNLSIKTSALRLTASKNLLFLGFIAGIGQDTYKTSAGISATVNTALGSRTASGTAGYTMTRNNMFISASMNLLLFRLVGEAGQVSGGSLPALKNTFGEPADKSRTYYTLGLRFAI